MYLCTKLIKMALFNLNSRVRPKTFTYIPQYYDEEKERFEETMGEEVDYNDPNVVKGRISRGIKRGSYSYERGKTTAYRRKSNMLAFGIGILLVVLIIFVVIGNVERILTWVQ